jgi:hypothetical protein
LGYSRSNSLKIVEHASRAVSDLYIQPSNSKRVTGVLEPGLREIRPSVSRGQSAGTEIRSPRWLKLNRRRPRQPRSDDRAKKQTLRFSRDVRGGWRRTPARPQFSWTLVIA